MGQDVSRRHALLALSAWLTTSGCATQAPLCADDPGLGNGTSSLTIDVHAHVFNGSDLQIKEFLLQTATHKDSELVQLVRVLGTSLLQAIAWQAAPGAADERRALDAHAAACRGGSALVVAANPAFQDGYRLGRDQLRQAARAVAPAAGAAGVLGPDARGPGLGAAIEALPERFDDFARQRTDRNTVLGAQPHLLGYLDFVLHHFNYRHVNALDYLDTYSRRSERKIDLLVACLVDYDWWLAGGSPTATPLIDQVELMGLISALTAGRVHGFAPFCPFRETMSLGSDGIGDSLRLVMRAVQDHGFIGVKVYPPMGFAAWGNASLDVWKGNPRLDPAARQAGFGARLDAAMEKLYVWCIANDVPIMAHSNRSNGPSDEFRALAGAEYWAAALDRFPGLRVSFGHTGDTEPEDHEGRLSTPFIRLMSAADGSPRSGVFADSGYFGGVLSNPVGVAEVLDRLYRDSREGVLRERLMYGTDWTMILPLERVETYLSQFVSVLQRVEAGSAASGGANTGLSTAFFGANAADFLGLRPGRKARRRLEQFYERNAVRTPNWIGKLG